MAEDKLEKVILNKIKEKNIKPRSRWVYILLEIFGYTGIGIILLWVVFLLSVCIYLVWHINIYEDGEWHHLLIYNTPWQAIILIVLLLLASALIIRHVATYYRYRRRLVLIVVFFIVGAAAIGLQFINLHDRLYKDTFLGKFYDSRGNIFGVDKSNYIVGSIVSNGQKCSCIVVDDKSNHQWKAIITASTKEENANLKPGDYIKIIGDKSDHDIRADLIRKVIDKNE